MPRKKRVDHLLHQYKKVFGGKQYRCTLPKCTHLLPAELLLGRAAQCPYCNEEYIVTEEHMRRINLHCLKCTKAGKPVNQLTDTKLDAETSDVFEKLLSEGT